MSQSSKIGTTRNRRASRRLPPRGTAKVECRKGSYGFGPNLAHTSLDLSETGVRLLLKACLDVGQEVEVLVSGGYGRPLKRTGRVIWAVPTENDLHCVGIHFDSYLPYAELQSLTRPPRTLG